MPMLPLESGSRPVLLVGQTHRDSAMRDCTAWGSNIAHKMSKCRQSAYFFGDI